MKILILGDSHGHIINIKTAIEIGINAGIKAIVHCGDWDNLESFDTVQKYKIPLYTVLGNADVDSDLQEAMEFESKKYNSYFLKFELDGRKIGIVHRLTNTLISSIDSLDVVFCGHYHSKEEKMFNFVKFIRPGALINGLNFAIYETVTNEAEFISENEN